MRLLIFGGTVLLSRAVAAEAVRRGHDVVCAARGKSGSVPEGARLVRVDRDDPSTLEQLSGEQYDSVLDTSLLSHTWTADALRVLGRSARHWMFVSSVNVYADHQQRGQRPGAPVLAPRAEHATVTDGGVDPQLYGAIKVAGENAVLAAFPDAFVVRPGLISGPGDHTDRFGYWPMRFARGGQVVVPDVPEQPAQYVDVRDLAAWIVDAAEQRIGGVFDAITPPAPLPDVLAEIAEAVGFDGELVPAPVEKLHEAEVKPWSGPRSLPLWAPADMYGMLAHDAEPAVAAGLRHRSLADAARAALEHERALGVDRERLAGLSPEDETAVISIVGK
jgi:nucleoside-diphosphate-sugar epimerase